MAILRVRDDDGNIFEIPAIKGDKGDKGDPGYVLTDSDKAEIIEGVLSALPNASEVMF